MTNPIEDHLDRAERCFASAAALLAQGDAPAFAQASGTLQAVVLELAEAVGDAQRMSGLDAAQRQRMGALAQGLGVLREGLLRRSAYVHQALQVVVPTPAPSTYGKASSPFGAMVPQSGQFKVLAA